MLRRQFLISAAALSLAGCGVIGGDGDVTVQDIVDWLKKNCSFSTSIDAVVAVVLTIVTSFNAQAGAAATVAASVAKTVEDAICNAVKLQAAQNKLKASPSQRITVVVNGVKVEGTYGS
jgi:hypothetical protein